MIHTQDLEKIVALTLCSAYVKGDKPLSLLIISDRPESGKTELVKRFRGTPHVEFATDLSGYGIKRDLAKGIMTGDIRHIVIPELLQPLGKSRVAAASFVNTLAAIMEDGVMGLHTGFCKPVYDGKGEVNSVGVIGCMPRPAYTAHIRYEWLKTGFLSRWLVVTYRYSDDTVQAIFDSIDRGDYLDHETELLEMMKDKVDVELPPDVSSACQRLGIVTIEEARKQGLAYGFREVRHIRSLVAANVVYERVKEGGDRDTATMADFQEVERLGYLFNEQYNEVRQ